MDNDFALLGEEERERKWKHGYFETIAKRSGGAALIVCGIILALVGLCIAFFALTFLIDLINGESYEGITGITIFLWFLALAFIVPGILVIRFGFKRKKMNVDTWIKKSSQESDYPESVIRDFAKQAVNPGSVHFRLAGSSSVIDGVLTTDYIFFANLLKLCVIKRSDIVGAYLVSLPDSVSVGNKIKTVHTMNVAIFSNHMTYITTAAKQKKGAQLIAMLAKEYPNIDTADGKVISDKEYDKLVSSIK